MDIEGFIEIESIDWPSQAGVVGGGWWVYARCAGCVHSTNSSHWTLEFEDNDGGPIIGGTCGLLEGCNCM